MSVHRRITLTKEDGWWVATDEEIGDGGIASQGQTREEALENLDEAVARYKGEIESSSSDSETGESTHSPEEVLDNLDTFLTEREESTPPSVEPGREDYHARRHREQLERIANEE